MNEKELSATQITDEDLEGVSGGNSLPGGDTQLEEFEKSQMDVSFGVGGECRYFVCKSCGEGIVCKSIVNKLNCPIHRTRKLRCTDCTYYTEIYHPQGGNCQIKTDYFNGKGLPT